MKLLVMIAVWTAVLLLLNQKIKKYAYLCYGLSLCLGVLSLWRPENLQTGILQTFFDQYIQSAACATALFVIVMYAILMPAKSRVQKVFMGLRRECAIMGAFLILPHNIHYASYYCSLLWKKTRPLQPYEMVALFASVIMFLLLIPLTVTSFPSVRKRMNAKKWKALQRWSYLFYALLYCHVLALMIGRVLSGDAGYGVNLAVYTIVFGGYAGLRIRKALLKYAKRNDSFIGRKVGNRIALWISAVSLVFGGFCLWSTWDVEVATAQVEEATSWQDGVYEGSGSGYNGKIKVQVTVTDGKIADLEVMESVDDDSFFKKAWKDIKESILETQFTQIDAVTGATYSSRGITDAVQEALQQSMQ